MTIDSPNGQTKIAIWSFSLTGVFCIPVYLLGYKMMTYGMLFGVLLMLLNWRMLSKILRIGFSLSYPQVTRIIAFATYHLRFWLIALLMFFIIPKTNLYFGIGVFLGLLIPKLIIGPIVYGKGSQEWWSQKLPAQGPHHKEPTYIEKELLNHNPFEVNLVDVEVKRYYNNVSK